MAKELYVGHISESATEEDLVRLFSVMGTVTSVHLIVDPVTKEFKRCGYVRMSSSVDPNEVVETLDGALLHDQQITVSIARPKKPGMSKGPARFGGAGKPRTSPRATANAMKSAPKGTPERKTGTRPSKTSAPRAAGAESSGGYSSQTSPKPGRSAKASGRPPRQGGRKR